MEFTGIGVLPEEIITFQILPISSLKTASSILLSCKYFYNKYKHIINHDTIVIINDETDSRCRSNFTKAITIKNGRVIRYGDRQFHRNKHNSCLNTNIGFFDTVAELTQFLKTFNSIVSDNTNPIDTLPAQYEIPPYGFWMRIQKSTKTEYFNCSESNGATYMHMSTAIRIIELIDDLKLVSLEDVILDEEAIKVEFLEADNLRVLHYSHDIQINRQGDVYILSYLQKGGQELFFAKTSPDLYNELKELIVCDRHKSSNKELDEYNNSYHNRRHFVASLNLKNESYQIVEVYGVNDDGTEMPVQIIARRPDVLRQFAKLLEIGLYGTKNIQNPLFNNKKVRILPPPQSAVYNLAKRFPYCVDLFGLPLTYQIRARLKRGRLTNDLKIARSDTGLAPIEEVIELFHFVEAHLDGPNPKEMNTPSYPPGSKPVQLTLRVYSISKFEDGVVMLPKEVFQRVWSFITKYHSKSIP